MYQPDCKKHLAISQVRLSIGKYLVKEGLKKSHDMLGMAVGLDTLNGSGRYPKELSILFRQFLLNSRSFITSRLLEMMTMTISR